MSESNRINELEMKIAYMEDTVAALDQIVTVQQGELAHLKKLTEELAERYRNLVQELPESEGEESPPPHY